MKRANRQSQLRTRSARARRPWLGLLMLCPVFAILVGCATATFVPTGDRYTAKPEDCAIQVFSSKLPDRGYEEIGILEGKGSLGKSSLENVLPKMKNEACLVGGDAIILGSSQMNTRVVGSVENGNISSQEELNVTATVIRWIEEN